MFSIFIIYRLEAIINPFYSKVKKCESIFEDKKFSKKYVTVFKSYISTTYEEIAGNRQWIHWKFD